MQAVVFSREKGLHVETIPIPVIGPEEVLVRVVNTGFCGSDHSLIESGQLANGVVLGHEVSGIVADTGPGVPEIKPGLRVIVRPTYCGECRECRMGKPYFCQADRRLIGMGDLPGAFSEYIRVFPQMLIPIPHGVDSRNAALAEAFAASLHGINLSRAKPGSVMVLGGGTIGLATTRLLKLKGFGPIVVTEPLQSKRRLALQFGADVVLDPLTENIGQAVFENTHGTGFETVFECSGVPDNIQAAIDYAARGGTVCIISVILNAVEFIPASLNLKEVLLTAAYSNTHVENMHCLNLMAAGELDGRPLITDLIPLEQLPQVYKERIQPGKAIKVMLRIGEEF